MQNNDQYAGMGGTYLLDPETGKRTQIVPPTAPESTGIPAAAPVPQQTTEADDVAITEEN